MLRLSLLVVPALVTVTAINAKEPPPARFKWVAGEVLTYKVVQQTAVRETLPDPRNGKQVTTEASTSLALTKKWTVKDVDANGVGTLEMTVTAMRNEFRRPDGSSVVSDSADPEAAKTMAGFLNVPVMTVKADPRGNLIDVKEARAGSAARLRAELPFRMTLPEAGPANGQKWDRTFAFKLDPPLGTGESFDFVQTYTHTGERDGLLSLTVATALKDAPKALAERVPLLPMLWEGEVYFNPATATGKYHAARLKVKAELVNHQGEGTKFEYESSYAEDAVPK